VRDVAVETPFGDPSAEFVLGDLDGRKVAFLARHGRAHSILPSEFELSRKHIRFQKLGVEQISLSLPWGR